MDNINKKAVNTLSIGHFIIDAYSGFLNPIMPFIAVKIGITMSIAAIMIAISNITASFSQPIFGYIADNWQKRFFIVWGMVLAAVFLSLMGFVSNIYALAFCLILGNMGVAFYHPQATSFVPYFSGNKFSNKNMSIYIALGTFGFALGPKISSAITSKWGLESLPFACIIGLIMTIFIYRNVPKVSGIIKAQTKTSLIQAFKDILYNKIMLILVIASVIKSFIVSAFSITLPFYWKNTGYDVSTIGTFLFIFLLCGALGVFLSPFVEKKAGVKNVFYISLIAVLPLTYSFYFFHGKNEILSITSFFLLGFISFLAVPLNMSMAQKIMPQYKSMISGFIGGFSWGVIGIVLPLITLWAEKIGIINMLLFISFIPVIFAYFIKYLPEKY